MDMLVGQYIQKVSDKGRTVLPSKFKKELGAEVVVARWYEGSLAIFDIRSWQQLVEQVTKDAVLGVPLRETERFLLGGAYEVELDDQGRFVVPQVLRSYAGIQNEVVFLGLGNRIELWSKEKWQEHEQKVLQSAEEMVEKITRQK